MKHFILIVVCFAMAACTSVAPPIQEMSDARLAIAAAADAGADKYAGDVIAEARISLRSAEKNLQRKAYAAAKRDAALAKQAATSARETAETRRSQPDRMTEQPLK